jgi:hypothetical protein
MGMMRVLAVGVDVSPYSRARWERCGLYLVFAQSPGEAISTLRYGHFDVCLLGNSVSADSRAKLVSALRDLLGSRIPVMWVTDEFRSATDLNMAAVKFHPEILGPLQELLFEAKNNAQLASIWGKACQRERDYAMPHNRKVSGW